MDRCPHCNKRMITILSENGRTEFRCLDCDEVEQVKTKAEKDAANPPVRAADAA